MTPASAHIPSLPDQHAIYARNMAELWRHDPVLAMASGWMSVKQRAKQLGVELPLVISDHADWNELRQTIVDTGAEAIWVTHGREDALCYWCETQGLAAEPLRIEAYEDGEEET